MKYIKSKKLNRHKYILTLEVSEQDLQMLEDLATTYAPFQYYQDHKYDDYSDNLNHLDYTEEYKLWLLKIWREFWKIWHKHDKSILRRYKTKK